MHVPPRSRGSALAKAEKSFAAQKILLPAQRFFHTETTSGLMLLAAAIAALAWANSPASDSYARFWNSEVSIHFGRFSVGHTLREWINDALMVLFFFVVGLEIKREFVHGQLSGWKRSSLPVICALGGMIVPAALYSVFNANTPAASGWGIPMATDIAFALGVLALIGDRIPSSARIFLLALATVDDIGAIIVIALFYTEHLAIVSLICAVLLAAFIVVMQKLGVRSIAIYIPFGVLFWIAVFQSGVHATIAGVVLGLLTPTEPVLDQKTYGDAAKDLTDKIQHSIAQKDRDLFDGLLGRMEQLTTGTEAPADRLVRILHPWSGYVVLPIFALANAGVVFSTEIFRDALSNPVTQGVVAGLVAGKFIGITLFAYVATRLRIATLAEGVNWLQMFGLALLAGVGFTVSLFITDLAFEEATYIEMAKIGVLIASFIAGVLGFTFLRMATPRTGENAG